jgi:hypothetical protein
VPRIGRLLDLVGAILFLAGAAVYARSWLGLRAMDEFERTSDMGAFAAVERADALSRLGLLGFALMGAGAVVAVIAAIVAKRVARGA